MTLLLWSQVPLSYWANKLHTFCQPVLSFTFYVYCLVSRPVFHWWVHLPYYFFVCLLLLLFLATYRKIQHVLCKYYVTNEEIRAKIEHAIGTHEDLQTIVKIRKLQWYGHVSRSWSLAKPSCKAQWKGEEDKADRSRGGKTTSMDRSGVRQVPEGSGKKTIGLESVKILSAKIWRCFVVHVVIIEHLSAFPTSHICSTWGTNPLAMATVALEGMDDVAV